MALAEAADRRIAGHRADRRRAVGQQRGPGAHPGGRGRGLAARMAAADHDDVEVQTLIVQSQRSSGDGRVIGKSRG